MDGSYSPAAFDNAEIAELRNKAHSYRRAHNSFKTIDDLERQLRYKRKALLGSGVPLTSLVGQTVDGEFTLSYRSVAALTEFLAARTCAYWCKPYEEAIKFCRQFFSISIIALARPNVYDQCLDDLVFLSHVLVTEDKKMIEIAMLQLLEEQHHASFRAFLDEVPADFADATFEQGVLSAVSIFLEALDDPLGEEE